MSACDENFPVIGLWSYTLLTVVDKWEGDQELERQISPLREGVGNPVKAQLLTEHCHCHCPHGPDWNEVCSRLLGNA